MENHRSRGGYVSNGAIQDADQDEGIRDQRLLALQLEALGSTRRHAITTQGYKEDLKEETSSLSVIERARRVNKSGTVESRITNDVKAGLTSWSSAWMQLEQDGTAESSLDTMNDGQTHRAKLMSDPSVRIYKEDSEFFSGSSRGRSGGTLNRPRGGGRGGRGGGQIGNRPGRHGPARVPAGMPSLSSVEEEQELIHRKGRGTFQYSSPGKVSHSTQGQGQKLKASKPIKTVSAKHAKPDQALASPSNSVSARPKSGPSEADLSASTKVERSVPLNAVDRPPLAAPNTFMAAAKRMFKLTSTKKAEPMPLALEQSTSTVKPPVQRAANLPPREILAENTAPRGVTSTTDRLSMTSPAILAAQIGAFKKPEAMARDAKSASSPNHRTADTSSTVTNLAAPSPSEKAGCEETELPSAVARFLSDYGSAMPSGMLLNLQGYLVGQAISNDPKTAKMTAYKKADASAKKTKDAVAKLPTDSAEAKSVGVSAKPKIVIKLPQLVNTNQEPTATQPFTVKASSTSVVNKPSFQPLKVRQEIFSPPAPPKAPVPTRTSRSNEPIALETRLVQSSASPVVRIKGDGRARAVILGEHVFKDRYSIDDDNVTSPMNSTVDAQSPIIAALSHLSLREQHRPSSSVGGPARSVDTDIKPVNSSPAVPVKSTRQGVAQSLLTAAETPNLIGSAVERPSPPRYATENPFVQPLPREKSRAAIRAPPFGEAFVQPVLEGRSRASSRATSTEVPPSARVDSLSATKRFPTTPYSWNEDTKRAPSGDSLKPQLPAFLQGLQPNKDPAAAARAQYGGIVAAGNKYAKKENEPLGKEKDPLQSAQARGYRYTGL